MNIRRNAERNNANRRIKVVLTNERLITPSGLSIVGGLLGQSDFVRHCNRIPLKQKRSEPQIKNGDILLSYIGVAEWKVKRPVKTCRKSKNAPQKMFSSFSERI